MGTPVTYVDAQGVTRGTVTVKEMADPYTAFDPTSPPRRAQRYVLLTLVFEAVEDQAFGVDPYQITLQDTNGYLIGLSGVPLGQDDRVPFLEGQTMAPGDRISGHIGFVVPDASQIATVLYSPESGRLIPLVDVAGQ